MCGDGLSLSESARRVGARGDLHQVDMDPITAATAALAILNVMRQMNSKCSASHAEASRLITRCEVLYGPLEEISRGERPIQPEMVQKILSAVEYSKKQVTKFMDNSVKGRFDRVTRRTHYLEKFRHCNQLISDCCQDINLVLAVSAEQRRQQDLDDQKLVLSAILQELKEASTPRGKKDETTEDEDEDEGFLLEKPVISGSGFSPDDDALGSASGFVGAEAPTGDAEVANDLNVFEEQRKLAEEEARLAEIFANVEIQVRARETKEMSERLTGFAIRNHHGRFATATPDGELRWNTKEVLGWERFNADILAFDAIEGQYKIAIKTAHGKYITARGDGRWACGATGVGVEEMLILVTHPDARISLRGSHGRYMRTPGPELKQIFGALRAFVSKEEEVCYANSSDVALDWERFQMIK